MLERLIGYRTFSYEDWLIEYHGTVIYNPLYTPTMTAYMSPGIDVVRNGVGDYTVSLTDKVPIRSQILGQNAPTNWPAATDAGFASTLQIYVSIRNDQALPTVTSSISAGNAFLSAPNRVDYNVVTSSNGIAADVSWCFAIVVTGQPMKFVFGLGA